MKHEIIEKVFDLFLQKYEDGLEKSMRESKYIRDIVDLLYYHIQKIGLKRDGSYIDFPEWLKNKKATTNPKNN